MTIGKGRVLRESEDEMEFNVGSVDRVMRIFIRLALLAHALPTIYPAFVGLMPGWSALGSWS